MLTAQKKANDQFFRRNGIFKNHNVGNSRDVFNFNDIFYHRKKSEPVLALKTNLLYDAASFLNLELEIPIGKHISACAEYIGPWWIIDNGTPSSKRHRIQATMGTLECRYWFGNRTSQKTQVLTGWFAGIYGTYGKYDFEFNKKGVQSEGTWSGGITGGFAHKINTVGSWRMEYSVALGYMRANYKEYTSEYNTKFNEWRAYRDHTQTLNWLGPTRLKVSLVWIIFGNKKGLYRE